MLLILPLEFVLKVCSSSGRSFCRTTLKRKLEKTLHSCKIATNDPENNTPMGL